MSEQSLEPVGETWKLNPDYHKMSDFLGVNVYDRNDFDLAKKMSHIHDWAMEKGKGKTLNDALWQVRGLQKELGNNFIGKPLINEMYKYIRLKEDSKPAQHVPNQTQQQQNDKKEVKKQTPIQKVVAQTVQQSISGMVQKALSDPKLIQGTVQNAVKEALK